MENNFKMRFYSMFRSSLISCKSKNTIDDIEDPSFIPKATQNRQHYQLIKHFLPHPRPFPSMCRPKWPERLSEERKCLLVSTEIEGRKCPPVSPISPFNTHYEFQKIYSEKKTRKTINKNVHSTTKNCDFRDKEEFTTEKCGTSNGFKAGSLSRRAQRKIHKESSMTIQEGVKDSLAVVKRSSDPYTDFRTSMVEMIVEKQIFTAKGLESLLQCFLSLNSYHHHRVIIEVFSEIWEDLFVSYV